MWSHKLEQCTCAHLTAYSRSTTLGLRNNHRSQARTQPVIISVILAYCTHTVCTHIILSLDHVPNYYNSPYQWGCFSLSSVDGGMYDDLLVYNMARNSLLHPLHTVGLILRTTLITTECDLALSLTSLHPSWQIIYCALFLLKIIVTDKVFSYLFMMPQRSLGITNRRVSNRTSSITDLQPTQFTTMSWQLEDNKGDGMETLILYPKMLLRMFSKMLLRWPQMMLMKRKLYRLQMSLKTIMRRKL